MVHLSISLCIFSSLSVCLIYLSLLSVYICLVIQSVQSAQPLGLPLPEQDPYEMKVFTWVGLTLSLVCLLACILTFALIRSIQSPRNSIHLHLCLSLFVANLVFLCGITRTENQVTVGGPHSRTDDANVSK